MDDRPLIMLAANQAWNLVNFRSGLIRALKADGFRLVAVAPSEATSEARLAELGCDFVPVVIDPAGLSPLRDLRTFVSYVRIMRELRPAAWLSWTIKPNVYGSLAAAHLGIVALPNVSGLGTAFIGSRLLRAMAQVLYRGGFARANAVFFQNREDRDLFIEQRLVGTAQARLLPGSGIDAGYFAPPDLRRPPRRRFLMVARVVADKGVREYVAAARRVRQRWPDARFRLLGFLDVANRTAISRQEVADWAADGTIDYLPPTSDVRSALAEADFVVLPSYREGLSRVLLEAAAMRRPIVTTDVPGCRDVVEEGGNGYLCAPRNVTSLEAALERAATTEDAEWHRMADAGRAVVVSRFSQEQVNNLYRAALIEAGVAAPAGAGPGTS